MEGKSKEASTTSNITSDEVDDETAKKLRGDAIGDTMYSEVFVLNTLMHFSELRWNEEVEDNLCFLWDMTEETDVCRYLFQVSYPSLACSALAKYDEPRFVEIIVGILANLLCSPCEKNISEGEVVTVMNLLSSDDPYILTQVMRFLHAVSFMFDKLPFVAEEHLERFNFVLGNSTNKDLLMVTLKTMGAITVDMKLSDAVVKGELLKSAIVAYRTLKENTDCEDEFDLFALHDHKLFVKHLIQFTCNTCCYIDNLNVTRLKDELNVSLHEFTHEMTSLLNHFGSENNLLPVDEDFKFYIEALTYIYRILAVNYNSTIVGVLCKILFILREKDCANLKIGVELLCYFISVGTPDCLKVDFRKLPTQEVKGLLSDINENGVKYEFDHLCNLRNLLYCL